ncbi:hypothetical protein ACFLR6_01595 [Campylobacterota bacterium]
MPIKQELKNRFETLESTTVSGSFGGGIIAGRAPIFAFKPIIMWYGDDQIDNLEEPLSSNLNELKSIMTEQGFKYTLECLGRFSFCIELTNLSITSTKMKTRWVSGRIIKTLPNSYSNYEGTFAPGVDKRSNTFDACHEIFSKCVILLKNSVQHRLIMEKLACQANRGTAYEMVFTYINPELELVHQENNIRLVHLHDIDWLVKARPIIQPTIRFDLNRKRTKINEKIATKCYKTDRSQTGEVQTNRAKRWECLVEDFQHATIEQCWSVERKLLADLSNFEGFPEDTKQLLRSAMLMGDDVPTLCPITFEPMVYVDLLGGGGHGESEFQIGHMYPLKAGGVHQGDNVEWISNNGNRIQGSLSVPETRELLKGIFTRMAAEGLI